FSSRRRHTRFSRDWSSDVCSSDLQHHQPHARGRCRNLYGWPNRMQQTTLFVRPLNCACKKHCCLRRLKIRHIGEWSMVFEGTWRSEERRVGKECKFRSSRDCGNKK